MTKRKSPKSKPAPSSTAYSLPTGRVLMLRTCMANLTVYGGFQWPASGLVEAPDWDPRPECGNGLHGLLWGEGDSNQLHGDDATRMWLVCEVEEASLVHIERKVKAPRAWVVFCSSDRAAAVAFLQAHAPAGNASAYGTATAGDRGTATAGEGGSLSVRWWDRDCSRYRVAQADVGVKEACKPGVKYVVTGKGILTEKA